MHTALNLLAHYRGGLDGHLLYVQPLTHSTLALEIQNVCLASCVQILVAAQFDFRLKVERFNDCFCSTLVSNNVALVLWR